MIRLEDILDKVESYKPDFDEALLQKAYIFSAREHRGQTRSSGDPYLIHPLNVAYILAEEKRVAIAKQTMEIYAPIANRLGMGRIKSELEDLAFQNLHPREHEDLESAISQKLAVSADLVDRIKATLAKKLGENDIHGE